MNQHDPKEREIEALRARISSLSAAILRISASLDLATVLQEVVDSARALTGARYGIIATLDWAEQPLDFISSGFTPEERAQLVAWPEGPRLFEQFRDLEAPLRLDDLPGYVHALGFSTELMFAKTFQGTPMRHRGEPVGIFFLAGKDGDAGFTAEDEEVLTLFSSQAATAIANARTYRGEQRARADLEALVETSPVGVVVFDVGSGGAVSFNREARRIVEGLLPPGAPPEALLKVATYRRGDGREVSLAELPLAEELRRAETVRAEEVEISVPDGRSLTVLVNVTPIRSGDGAVVSVVVTMQDLGPLEDLERQRAQFLGLVSHELRAPLMAIKGASSTLLGATADLDPAETRAFHRIIDTQADHMRGLIGDLLDAGRIEAGTLTVEPEPTEVAALVERARNTFQSGGGRHAILVDLPPDLPRAMADRRRIVQVLNNLFSNAARHAPEPSPIRVEAARDGVHVAVSVRDEGRGIPPERLGHLFRKHAALTGADDDDGAAGTGLGLAICKGLVEAHGGRIRAESGGTGQGARFTFTLPVAAEAAPGPAPGLLPESASAREPRVLVVDDDRETLRFVRKALAAEGYAPVVTGDPGELSRLITTESPALVLLDLMLPGADGIELMRSVPELAGVPVIFISVYGRDETIARALSAGAADYLVKPFSPTELTARVGAALRKRAGPEAFELGDLAIDYGQRRVSVAGEAVRLTATEFELLRLLSVNAGRVVTREALLAGLWPQREAGGSDPLRNFVRRLRDKLGDSAESPLYIFNEHGVGYRMPRPDDARGP